MNLPLVSIIISTRNEENNIRNCLDSIAKQSYSEIEIIIVDNGSVDNTMKIAKEYTDKIFVDTMKCIPRNLGVRNSNGEYVMFVDADMILTQDLVWECVDISVTNNIDYIYTPEKISGNGFWVKVRDFERSFYNKTCIDAPRFIKKECIVKAGMFDESMIAAEDWDLARRLSGKPALTINYIIHNDGNLDLKSYLYKKAFYANDISKYIKKWGKNDSIIKKQLGFKYRFVTVFTEDYKWIELISHPLLSLSMYYLKSLVGIMYIKASFVQDNPTRNF